MIIKKQLDILNNEPHLQKSLTLGGYPINQDANKLKTHQKTGANYMKNLNTPQHKINKIPKTI